MEFSRDLFEFREGPKDEGEPHIAGHRDIVRLHQNFWVETTGFSPSLVWLNLVVAMFKGLK